MNDAEETTEAGGWSVCPICGAVIADINAHITYHETAVPEVIAEIIQQHEQTRTQNNAATETEVHEAADEKEGA